MSKLSNLCVNTQANSVSKLLGKGKFQIYTGKQPVSVDEKADKQNILAELVFPDPAFNLAIEGLVETTKLKKEEDAKDTGKATWFRCVSAKGQSIIDGSIGLIGSDADLVLSDVEIKKHAEVSISKFSYCVGK